MSIEVTKEMYDKEYVSIKREEEISKAKNYLNNTDFYYTRLSETGESVPEDVAKKRNECRKYIRASE